MVCCGEVQDVTIEKSVTIRRDIHLSKAEIAITHRSVALASAQEMFDCHVVFCFFRSRGYGSALKYTAEAADALVARACLTTC
jgi:hypothetical protein